MSTFVIKNSGSRGYVASLVCAATGLLSAQAGAERLTSSELRQKIPGAIIHLDTPLGSVVPISYGPDGVIEGKAGAVAFYLGSEKDRGKWWIEGSAVCHQWNTWFNGKKKCLTVDLKAANRVEWTDQEGDKGTATVIAMGGAEPDAARQVAAAPNQAQPSLPLLQAAPPRPAGLGAAPTTSLPEAKPGPAVAPPKFSPLRPATAGVPKNEAKSEPKSAIEKPVAVALAPPPAPAMPPPPQSIEYRVTNVPTDDVLNMRRGPSAATEIVATIPAGATGLKLAGNCTGEWCPVARGPHFGWVHKYFIAAPSAVSSTLSQPNRNPIGYRVVGVAPGDVLNIRRVPDSDADVVATIPPNGNRIRLTGYCRREWCPVAHGRNEGWVNRQYLAVEF